MVVIKWFCLNHAIFRDADIMRQKQLKKEADKKAREAEAGKSGK